MDLQFQDITLDTKPIIESYTQNWKLECSDFSFTNLFIWGCDGKMQYAEQNDVLYIKLSFPGFPTFLWAPLPKQASLSGYQKHVETAFSYLKGIGALPALWNVLTPFKDEIKKDFKVKIEEQVTAEDYVYLTESLTSLKGKKLHGKRNHINKFIMTYPDFKYQRLTPDMYEECMALYDFWSIGKDNEDEEATATERKSVTLALQNMEALGLVGGVIKLDGKIEAFTVGEKLFADMRLIHIEKANAEINGLYPIINQQYVFRECQDVTYINREEDMGIDGMRQAKRSYQPVKMIEKFRITLQE